MRGVLHRAAGMAVILRMLPGQQRALHASLDELLERRDRNLRETVMHAAAHVPFYRELFARQGIDPLDIRGPADLALLPTVSRADLLDAPERFRAESEHGRDGVMLRSSGTTGQPLDLFHDRRSVLANVAYGERERAIETHFVGKRLRYTRLHLTSDYEENVDRVRGLAARASYRPFRPRYRRASSYRDHATVVDAIDEIRPDVLMAAGSLLEGFFRVAAARRRPRHLPSVILYTWDHLTPDGRRLIEETFGIPVISRYSAMESLKIGFVCEERRGFHLHEDLCHVEVRRGDGNPAPAGETGELVLSNLVNRGSVLLNYRIGDLGAITEEPCTCGRTTRRLAELEGRVNDLVELPDGRLVGVYGISAAVTGVPNVLRYRLVQRAPRTFELELAMVEPAAFDDAARRAVEALHRLLPGCEVEAVYREEIALEPGRKYRPVVPLARG